jgi:hypothetical protein
MKMHNITDVAGIHLQLLTMTPSARKHFIAGEAVSTTVAEPYRESPERQRAIS